MKGLLPQHKQETMTWSSLARGRLGPSSWRMKCVFKLLALLAFVDCLLFAYVSVCDKVAGIAFQFCQLKALSVPANQLCHASGQLHTAAKLHHVRLKLAVAQD